MQEDNNLKDFLQKWAVETPSADFTSQVMQRVIHVQTKPAAASSKQKLPLLLPGAFVLVCIVLFALSFYIPTAAFVFLFNVKLSAPYLSQSFSFLFAFWVVMLLNWLLKKYFASHSSQSQPSTL